MDRLKRSSSTAARRDSVYLHSNMDRLKHAGAGASAWIQRYLHSNMDRLKQTDLTEYVYRSAIYIPIWID